MRKVTIKQLYKDLSKELADLPFTITRRGVPIAVVGGLDDTKGLDQKPVKRVAKSRPIENPHVDHFFRPRPKI